MCLLASWESPRDAPLELNHARMEITQQWPPDCEYGVSLSWQPLADWQAQLLFFAVALISTVPIRFALLSDCVQGTVCFNRKSVG